MLKYITIRKMFEYSGYTEDAIRGKIARGDWLEDVVWKRAPDGRILILPEGYEQWVEEQACDQHLKAASR